MATPASSTPTAPAAPAAPTTAPSPAPSAASTGAGFRPGSFRAGEAVTKPVAPAPAALPGERAAAESAAAARLQHESDPEPQLEGDVSEQPQAPVDPLDEQIHGMSARELIKSLKDGTILPESLLDVLEHEYDFGDDDKHRMTLREALDMGSRERMQLRDYSRAMGKLRTEEARVRQNAEALQAAVSGLNNHKTLVEDLFALGVAPDEFELAVREYAAQQVEYRKLPPHMKKILDGQREQRIENAKLRQQLEQMANRERGAQDAQMKEQASAVLKTHAQKAFEKHGLNFGSAYIKKKFGEFALQLAGDKPLTREIVFQAAEATAQDERALRREGGGRQPAGQPITPSRQASPAANALRIQQATNGRREKGYTPSQFGQLRRS